MVRVLSLIGAAALLTAVVPRAYAQLPPAPDGIVVTQPAPPPETPTPPASVQPVEAAPLAAPDAFSTPARTTGLPPILWRGTSLQVAQAVLPLLADHPLSPAAAALARRVLATGAPGPEGAAQAQALTAGRAAALMSQGDPRGAAQVLARAPGLERSPDAAKVAAESALLAGEDARACQIEQALTAGRDDIYWVRLRAYCQAIGGRGAEAQLTYDLAQSQARDAAFGRLMGAKLAGGGDPGAPSLRNGLDYALSRNLGLDLNQAKPSPAVAAALAQGEPADPGWDLSASDLAPVAQPIAAGAALPAAEIARLLDATDDPKARGRFSAAALFAQPFAGPPGPALRARLAALGVAEGRAPAGRNFALEAAADEGRIGETALLALWTCAEAGPGGLAVADRARIVRALLRVGLDRDARAFALEGLAALK